MLRYLPHPQQVAEELTSFFEKQNNQKNSLASYEELEQMLFFFPNVQSQNFLILAIQFIHIRFRVSIADLEILDLPLVLKGKKEIGAFILPDIKPTKMAVFNFKKKKNGCIFCCHLFRHGENKVKV